MAEEQQNPEAESGGEGANAGKKGGSKLVIILIAIILLGAAGAGFMLIGGSSNEDVAAEEVVEEAPAPVEIPEAYFYELPEMTVNLVSTSGGSRFLRLKVNLELASEADVVALEKVLPRVVDDFQVFLRELRVDDLQGSAGTYRLKEALLMRVNQAAQPLEISNVLLKEILVQ